jgi:hypothetical protein
MLKAATTVNISSETEEEEDDVKLNERLVLVKTLLFETNKRTNERGLRVAALDELISSLNAVCTEYKSYGELIYNL